MTIGEFRTMVSSDRRRMALLGFLLVVLFFSATALMADFGGVWLMNRTGWPDRAARSLVVLPCLLVGAPLLGLLWAWARLRFAAARCPHCRCALPGKADVVVASRHCPGCGRRVLKEPNPERAANVYGSMDELRAADRENDRSLWSIAGTFAALGVLYGVVLGLGELSDMLAARGVGSDWLELTGLALAGIVGVILFRLLRRLFCRSFAHRCCPSYHALGIHQAGVQMLQPIVTATGCCPSCGKREVVVSRLEVHGPTIPMDALLADALDDRRGLRAMAMHWLWSISTLTLMLLLISFRRLVPSPLYETALVVLVVISLGVPLLRVARRNKIACPRCGRDVTDHRGLVIASRSCPRCSERIVRED